MPVRCYGSEILLTIHGTWKDDTINMLMVAPYYHTIQSKMSTYMHAHSPLIEDWLYKKDWTSSKSFMEKK